MRHRWAPFHKGVSQGRSSMLRSLPMWWGCPKLCFAKQAFHIPSQAEWMNKGRQNGSLPSLASTNKEVLMSSHKICCNSVLVDRKNVDHPLPALPGCFQAGGGSNSAVSHGQTPKSHNKKSNSSEKLQSDHRQCHLIRRHLTSMLWSPAKAYQGP